MPPREGQCSGLCRLFVWDGQLWKLPRTCMRFIETLWAVCKTNFPRSFSCSTGISMRFPGKTVIYKLAFQVFCYSFKSELIWSLWSYCSDRLGLLVSLDWDCEPLPWSGLSVGNLMRLYWPSFWYCRLYAFVYRALFSDSTLCLQCLQYLAVSTSSVMRFLSPRLMWSS